MLCEDCEEDCDFFSYCESCEEWSCDKCTSVLYCENGNCDTALVRCSNLRNALAAASDSVGVRGHGSMCCRMQCAACMHQDNCRILACPNCNAFACLECRASALDGACLSCDAPLWTSLEVRQFRMRHSAMQRRGQQVCAPRHSCCVRARAHVFDARRIVQASDKWREARRKKDAAAGAAAAEAAAAALLAEEEAEAAAAAAAQLKCACIASSRARLPASLERCRALTRYGTCCVLQEAGEKGESQEQEAGA
jgi:hypothetical protein